MASKIRARRSALLSTYGVGGLFPAENASYLILGLHEWDHEKLPPVVEPRLARQLQTRELKSPPATPDDRSSPNVPVVVFPEVLSCPTCGALGTVDQLNASRRDLRCGLCGDRGELMPSRFITACRAGHLQDFPYYEWAHGSFPEKGWQWTPYPTGSSEDAPNTVHVLRLDNRGRSSALSDIVVRCSCGKHRSLDQAFSPQAMVSLPCRGERPWLGREYFEKDCSEQRRTLQRGASNAWFAATTSAISIPPYSGRINEVVRKERDNLVGIPWEEFEAAAANGHHDKFEWVLRKYDPPVSVTDFASHAIEVMFPEAQRVLSEEEFRFEEYKAILEGAVEETDNQFVSEPVAVPVEGGDLLRSVRRVSRLREVMALHGFSRISSPEQLREEGVVDHTAALRPEDDRAAWFPAVELLGEGLFLELDRNRLEEWARAPFARDRKNLLDRNARQAAVRRRLSPDTADVDIVRVAVHTFAHMIIDQLALEAGYPSSALRERLYVGPDMAGVLVYTASSDSAGSLGGVAAMADPNRLGPALEEMQDRLQWCSADPVCIESSGSGSDGANLAACHNCVLLPETSCEVFNVQLDRGALFGTPEQQDAGFLTFAETHPAAHESGPGAGLGGPGSTDPIAGEIPDLVRKTGWEMAWIEFSALRLFIELLVEQDIPLPAIGEEIGKGKWPLDLSWEYDHVAVDSHEDHARDDALWDEGWTVFVVDPDSQEDIAEEVVEQLCRP